MLRPFKFVIQAVLLETDEAGNPIGERSSDPQTIYGIDAAKAWLEDIPDKVKELSGQEE